MAAQERGGLDRSIALHSGDYVERYNAKPLHRVRSLAGRMVLTNDVKIADFACGNGMLLHALGGRFPSYDGVDFSPDFVASAERSEGHTTEPQSLMRIAYAVFCLKKNN